MRKLLPASLLVLLVVGCAAQPVPDPNASDEVIVQQDQQAGFWMVMALLATTIYSVETAKSERAKAESAVKERQAEQIEAQSVLAGEHSELTEKQMELQMGQRQIELLSDLYLEQDRTEPRIVTLPTSREQPGIVDRINLWMDQALRA